MGRLFEWVQKERDGYHPVEFAAQLHKHFVFIHPFKDGNVTQRHQQKAA
nr:Fic family protein [uncultured Acetatifactor sp.]